MNNKFNGLDNKINKVGAIVAALYALHPLDFNLNDKLEFSVGYDNYSNERAMILSAFYHPNKNTIKTLYLVYLAWLEMIEISSILVLH